MQHKCRSSYEIKAIVKKEKERERTNSEKSKEKRFRSAFKEFSKSGWLPYLVDLDISRLEITVLSKRDPVLIDNFIYRKYCEKNYRCCKKLKKRLDGYFNAENHYYKSFAILYRNKEFFGCCMILFALIEQKLRLHAATDGQPDNLVPKAMDDIFKNMNFKYGIYSSHPSRVLCQKSLSYLINLYYKNADGFVCEPDSMNRNFLLHGMAKRQYTHKDCIQLMCILDYLCHFEEESRACDEKL